MRCIYCLKNENEAKFISPEHVISKALGTFGSDSNTPTLIQLVCDECNQAMGRELEDKCIKYSYLEIFRSGAMGTLKYQVPNLESKEIKNSALLTIRQVSIPGMEDKLVLTVHNKNGLVSLENSISFKLDEEGKEWKSYSLEYLEKNRTILADMCKKISELKNKSNSIYFTFDEEAERGRIIHLLNSYGIKIDLKSEVETLDDHLPENGSLVAEITLTINDVFRRFIAKIAFNYFVKYVSSDKKIDLYDKRLDPLREFIRDGVEYPELKFVPIAKSRILGQDDKLKYPNCFHLVSVEYKNGAFCAYVNLFNTLGYEMKLFEISGVSGDVFVGHSFDFVHKEVGPLISVERLRRKGIRLFVGPANPLPAISIARPRIFSPSFRDLLRFRWGK